MLLKKKVREVVVTKFLSILITVSLVLTSVSTLASAAPMPSAVIPTMMVQQGQINTNIIPFNVGRVTETLYNGEGRVLVTIQDLHSHRQTQENINSILKILDSKYGVKNIWLEGASGTLDTSWLANISDKKIKEQAVETLLSKGKLTGAELFSVQTNRPTIIKGLENKDVYLTNFERLYEIYNNRNEIAEYLPKIKAILDAKTEQYYSIENKKINKLQEKNKNGEVKADKYFAHIIRAANRAGISVSNYDQIAKYMFIMGRQKDINFRKVNEQISEIINKLKETLNYQQYKSLIEKVNNKETETEFYITIKKLAEEKEILGKYKEAVKFFDYIQYNEILNPILLAEQEEELINDIETSFARTGYEKDVLFLKKYFRLIENYLNNKITADDYRYFKNNETKFKNFWVKYVDVDGIIDIEKYFGLFNDFYNDNVERNRYFIENVIGTKPAEEKDAVIIKASDMYNSQAVEELKKEKDGIDVVITGGFHTRGLSRLFEEEKINYLVITPNVTDETLTSEKLYENMFREEYAVVSEKFANMPVSEIVKNIVPKVEEIENVKVSDTMIEFFGKDGAILSVYNFVDGTTVSSDGEKVNAAENEKLNQQQTEITARAFLSLQEYLKKQRENVRKQRIGEDVENISALRTKTEREISEIEDINLREAFENQLGPKSPALMQETGTIGRLNRMQEFLEGLGFDFSKKPFRHTVVGIAIGSLMEPFVSLTDNEDFAQRHGGFITTEQQFGRAIVAAVDVLSMIAASFIIGNPLYLGNLLLVSVAVWVMDQIAHNIYNNLAVKYNWETMQTRAKTNGIEIMENLVGKSIFGFNVENPDEDSLEYSEYEGVLEIREVSGNTVEILNRSNNILFKIPVLNVTKEADGEIIIQISDDIKIHAREYSEKVNLGMEFNALQTALDNLKAEYSETNRAVLKSAIESANKAGIDIKKDPMYKEKLDLLLSAVTQDHSYKSDGSMWYWDKEARTIFRNQRIEFVEKQRSGAAGEINIGENFFLPPIAEKAGKTSYELMDEMGIVSLSSILANKGYRYTAKKVSFVDAQMNGGIGSSVERRDWLRAKKVYEAMKGVKSPEEMQEVLLSLSFLDEDEAISKQEAQLSAKGSDLYFRVNVGTEENPVWELLSITDVKLGSLLEKKKQYKSVSVVMLTSPTSEEIVEELYRQPSRSDNKKSNREAINGRGEQILEIFGDEDISRLAMISQASYPSVRMEEDKFTLAFDKEAPGGHGVWLKTLSEKLGAVENAIVCISNSDAVNSGTPVEVSGYMIDENIGIVVLVATREDIDRKGGIVGLKNAAKDAVKKFVASIMELAQAKSSKNKENATLFTEMGFGEYEGTVPFNTNTVLINAGLFHAFLSELQTILSPEEYASIMSPDLIVNNKGNYIQLEGALGSSVFNLNERLEIMRESNKEIDALLNKYFPNGMVKLVLADKTQRTKIFTPFKFAVDFWIQSVSGKINPETMAWEVNRKEAVNIDAPAKVGDKNTVYADVYYLLRYWRDCVIDNLSNLFINADVDNDKKFGKIKMKNITLKGNVRINNATKEELLLRPDILEPLGFEKDDSGNAILENVRIDAQEKSGKIVVTVSKLTGKDTIDETSTIKYVTGIKTVEEFGKEDSYIVDFKVVIEQAEFIALQRALDNLSAEYSRANRQALKDAIAAANEVGVDVINDPAYKEKLNLLLSAVIKDHSYKSDGSKYYWDEEARDIFRNQRLEFVEKQRNGAAGDINIGENFFLPPIADKTGMSSEELMAKMGVISLSDILANDGYRETARKVSFVDAQMNGGIGSSVERKDWLKAKKIYEAMQSARTPEQMQQILLSFDFLDDDEEIAKQEAQLSAKGSDLYFRVNVGTETEPKWELLSITDVKLGSLLEKKKQYKNISVVMLTSPTSEEIVEELYRQPSRNDTSKNNREAINGKGANILEIFSDQDIAKFAMINQATYPSVKLDGNKFSLVFNKEAPGGHGVWLKTLSEKIKDVDNAIVCISNSDAVNSGTPVEVSGYMIEQNKGIVVLVATREDIDRKGGIVGLKKVVLNDGREIFVPSIMELAQAKSSKNKENAILFTEMGFGEYEGIVPFNTNTVLINAGLFHLFLKELEAVLSEDEYASIMSPDLIINNKTGYTQLEGALGSSVFNLNERLEVMRNEGNKEVDALLNKYFPNGMIGLVLANKEQRTKIFTPFKFAVDFWIQSVSGKINPETMAWEVNRKEAVNIDAPAKVGDKNTVYADVYYLLRYWRDCVIDNLSNLFINADVDNDKKFGKIKMKNITLKGNVRINNATKEELLLRPDILEPLGFEKDDSGNVILENVRIDAEEIDGKIILTVSKLKDKENIDESSKKQYNTLYVTVSEFGKEDMYIVPAKAQIDTGKEPVAQVLQNLIRAANEWLQMQILNITSLFKVKAEVVAIVDASDDTAIAEAQALAESGVKVKMILLNYTGGTITGETGNIIYSESSEALRELAMKNGNLDIIAYEDIANRDFDGKDAVRGILDDIKAGNIVGQINKKVLYITPSLLDGQEDITDEYTEDKSVLAVSTNSLKGAIAKGLLNYTNTRVQALKDMIIKPANIFGTYKAGEVTVEAIKALKEKGIDNIMIEVTPEIDGAVALAKENGMNIVVFGEGADKINIDGVSVAVSENPIKNQKQVVNYNQAITMKGDLSNVIVNISREEKENIVLTSDNIKSLINMGAAVAFDGVVLREISKENTAENGITMFDIIKAMFADTPQQKAEKEKARGVRLGRTLDLFISDEGFTGNLIAKNIKVLQTMKTEQITDNAPGDFLLDLIKTADKQGIVSRQNRILYERIENENLSRSEMLGILDGMLQRMELNNVLPELKDTDRIDNMNELMARLVEYRLLTGKSYNPKEGADVIKTLSDKTPDEIMKELQSMLQEEDLTDEYKAYVLNGIIELLLAENLQLDRDMSEMLDINTNKLHALLSAA